MDGSAFLLTLKLWWNFCFSSKYLPILFSCVSILNGPLATKPPHSVLTESDSLLMYRVVGQDVCVYVPSPA